MDKPQAPAGWYDSPHRPGMYGYWDGERWTEHFSPKHAPPTPILVSRTRNPATVPMITIVLVVGAFVALVLWAQSGTEDEMRFLEERRCERLQEIGEAC